MPGSHRGVGGGLSTWRRLLRYSAGLLLLVLVVDGVLQKWLVQPVWPAPRFGGRGMWIDLTFPPLTHESAALLLLPWSITLVFPAWLMLEWLRIEFSRGYQELRGAKHAWQGLMLSVVAGGGIGQIASGAAGGMANPCDHIPNAALRYLVKNGLARNYECEAATAAPWLGAFPPVAPWWELTGGPPVSVVEWLLSAAAITSLTAAVALQLLSPGRPQETEAERQRQEARKRRAKPRHVKQTEAGLRPRWR